MLTADQAKKLFVLPGPFTFKGSICASNGVIETRVAKDIWPKSISQITHEEAFYWTQTSGAIGSLEIRKKFTPGPEFDSRRDTFSAWFVARPCFALQILANQTKEEAEEVDGEAFDCADDDDADAHAECDDDCDGGFSVDV